MASAKNGDVGSGNGGGSSAWKVLYQDRLLDHVRGTKTGGLHSIEEALEIAAEADENDGDRYVYLIVEERVVCTTDELKSSEGL